jgi:hypothetical protein
MPRIKKTRIMSVREIIVWGINQEWSNAEIVALAKKKHPHSTLTAATVNYTRNQLKRSKKRGR